ncbi:6260_t:CDS:2 [Racocetra fulgida]|uniref:6260_t:CDS:1 n=1 Tax=Racocetra fulgida TaxID=60492 RepID=A0A9N8YYS3_9GLOM|nr:6260_t:CDS:2 [Racocetra fulgida]
MVTTKSKQLNGVVGNLSPDQAFSIDFHCGVSDKTLCTKAQDAFNSVGKRIASVLKLNTVIKVNATFTDFCKTLNECSNGNGLVLAPARSIPIEDDDNVTRLYPQALVKQMNLKNRPQYGDGKIKQGQNDFEYIVTHEFIHGLGFGSSWRNYFSADILTPLPVTSGQRLSGFVESKFDRYMFVKQNGTFVPMTSLTKQFNSLFTNSSISLNQFANSSQFLLSQQLFTSASTQFSMQFVTSSKDQVFLETGLKPFQEGSSISHVDKSFMQNGDFLMTFAAKDGVTLDDFAQSNGVSNGAVPYMVCDLTGIDLPPNSSNDSSFPSRSSITSESRFLCVCPSSRASEPILNFLKPRAFEEGEADLF